MNLRLGVAVAVAVGTAFGVGFVAGEKSIVAKNRSIKVLDCFAELDRRTAVYESMKPALTFYDTLQESPASVPAPDVAIPTPKTDSPAELADKLGLKEKIHAPVIASTGSKFAVQVASLPDKRAAEILQRRLVAKGYSAQVVQAEIAGKGKMYRVRIHGFETREKADEFRDLFIRKEHQAAMTVAQ